jgi:hypothetical protein
MFTSLASRIGGAPSDLTPLAFSLDSSVNEFASSPAWAGPWARSGSLSLALRRVLIDANCVNDPNRVSELDVNLNCKCNVSYNAAMRPTLWIPAARRASLADKTSDWES